MRSFTAAVTGLVAVLALAVALPLGWVATHVASEDGYVDFTSSLVEDETFRADVVDLVTDDVIERSGVPSSAAPTVREALTAASSRVVGSATFTTAFADAQRQSHRAVFGDPGDLPPELDSSNRLVIDLVPVAAAVLDALTADLPFTLTAPDQLLITVGGSEQRDALEAVDRTPQQALAVAGLALGAAVVSLLAARRRSVAIAWLGVGAAAAAGVVHLAGRELVPRLLERSDAPSVLVSRAQQLLADVATDSLDQWLLITAVAGAAALVVGLLARAGAGPG